MILLPIVAAAALWAIRRGVQPGRAWAIPLATTAALVLSAWLAIQTGEKDEERAEDIAGETVLHAHEAAAERFLLLSGGVLVLMVGGLMPRLAGKLGRVAATTAALALTIAGYQVGHSGGRVVYGDGTVAGVSALSPGQADGRLTGEDERGDREIDDD